jgi:hypothetical protein
MAGQGCASLCGKSSSNNDGVDASFRVAIQRQMLQFFGRVRLAPRGKAEKGRRRLGGGSISLILEDFLASSAFQGGCAGGALPHAQ